MKTPNIESWFELRQFLMEYFFRELFLADERELQKMVDMRAEFSDITKEATKAGY